MPSEHSSRAGRTHTLLIPTNAPCGGGGRHDNSDAASVGGQFEGHAVVRVGAITGVCTCRHESGERRPYEGCRQGAASCSAVRPCQSTSDQHGCTVLQMAALSTNPHTSLGHCSHVIERLRQLSPQRERQHGPRTGRPQRKRRWHYNPPPQRRAHTCCEVQRTNHS